MKKLTALCLTFVLAFALSVPAFATSSDTVVNADIINFTPEEIAEQKAIGHGAGGMKLAFRQIVWEGAISAPSHRARPGQHRKKNCPPQTLERSSAGAVGMSCKVQIVFFA